jgi:hypothetical protein
MRVDGRSNRKCSILGITQTAMRAPFGHSSRGRSTIAEYSKRSCSGGIVGGSGALDRGRRREAAARDLAARVLTGLRGM